MAIVESEIKFYQAANNNDEAGNGGVVSAVQIISNILNNLFPNVTDEERTAGLTRYRKMFVRNENTEELIFYHGYLWVSLQSLADDYFRLKIGTNTDIQSGASGYSDWVGAGLLDAPGSIGDPTIDVEFDAADGVYDQSRIRITDGVNTQDVVVNGNPGWVGTVATITLTDNLAYDFAAGTKVGAMVSLGNLTPSYNSWVETSVGTGVYDEDTYPLALYNVGAVYESWTLTFSDATNFSVVGASVGSVGSGDVNTDFEPTNGASYYFKLDNDGWGGAWADGDTITFNTVHAGQGVWVKQVVPAAIASLANNQVRLGWKGESANVLTTTTTTFTTTTTA